MRSEMSKALIAAVLFALAGLNLGAAPARVSANPIDDKVIKVYAYQAPPLVVLDDSAPGFLVELVKAIIQHPELPVEVEVSPVAVLMKYSIIQSVGAAAIGMDKDFSARDLQDLVSIPLLERDGKVYKLYFNTLNPIGAGLVDSTIRNLDRVKADGNYGRLLAKYGLK